jgi:hypothetical protein
MSTRTLTFFSNLGQAFLTVPAEDFEERKADLESLPGVVNVEEA